MKIEEEIKQTKFKNEYHKLLVNVLFTGNWLYALNTRFLKQHGLSPEQYNILRILRGQYPNVSTIFNLIDRMLDKMSNASRLVDKLVQKGLVDRKLCLEDRRKVDVKITQKGLDLLKVIDKVEFEMNLSHLPEKDAVQLNKLLDKMRDTSA